MRFRLGLEAASSAWLEDTGLGLLKTGLWTSISLLNRGDLVVTRDENTNTSVVVVVVVVVVEGEVVVVVV